MNWAFHSRGNIYILPSVLAPHRSLSLRLSLSLPRTLCSIIIQLQFTFLPVSLTYTHTRAYISISNAMAPHVKRDGPQRIFLAQRLAPRMFRFRCQTVIELDWIIFESVQLVGVISRAPFRAIVVVCAAAFDSDRNAEL